jgi:hypothetical protein
VACALRQLRSDLGGKQPELCRGQRLLLPAERLAPVPVGEGPVVPPSRRAVPRHDVEVDLRVEVHENGEVELVRTEQSVERRHEPPQLTPQ